MATQMLSDLGAEVIKIEPPSGDQARGIGAYGEGIVLAYNRGKRSIVLDLKQAGDRETALGLIAEADVVVQNLRADALARLGLGPDELRAANPRLVHVSVRGFSSRGPSAQRAGLDIAAQAESGLMSVNGELGGDPLRVGFPIADVAASYAVVQVVLAALLRRERTGEGGVAEVSLLDAAIHLQSAMWGEWHASGQEPRRKGNGQATVAPAADLVRTADGTIVLSAYTAEHFARLSPAHRQDVDARRPPLRRQPRPGGQPGGAPGRDLPGTRRPADGGVPGDAGRPRDRRGGGADVPGRDRGGGRARQRRFDHGGRAGR